MREHSHFGLDNHGLTNLNEVYWNLPAPTLYEKILTRREGCFLIWVRLW